ncbi:MAG: hypothetical protein SWK76_00345 [Actinomycetota bacterium]|nr:hypothetical protein [Actinomycetota bacterium]
MVRAKSAGKAVGPVRRSFSRPAISVLELVVAVIIITTLIAIAIPVWKNIRDNAYDSRALQNRDFAQKAVLDYWVSLGQENGGFKGFTADYMNRNEPGCRWVEAGASSIEAGDFKDLPDNFFASIVIFRDEDTYNKHIVVATFSETGKVYYASYRQDTPEQVGELAFGDFQANVSRSPQPNLGTLMASEW